MSSPEAFKPVGHLSNEVSRRNPSHFKVCGHNNLSICFFVCRRFTTVSQSKPTLKSPTPPAGASKTSVCQVRFSSSTSKHLPHLYKPVFSFTQSGLICTHLPLTLCNFAYQYTHLSLQLYTCSHLYKPLLIPTHLFPPLFSLSLPIHSRSSPLHTCVQLYIPALSFIQTG